MPGTAADVAQRLRAVQSGSMAGREYAATGDTALEIVAARTHVGSIGMHARHRHAGGGLLVRPRRRARARQHPRSGHVAVLLLLLALGAFGPYAWYRGPAGPPPPREPLLLADFSNSTGEAVFDGALKDALEIAAPQSPISESAAGVADPVRAAADGALAERAADRRRRARLVRAARRQGDPARSDRAAQLRVTIDHARGPGVPHRRHARPRSGAGGLETDVLATVGAPARRASANGSASRSARSRVQRPGAERDDAVARGVEGLRHGDRHAPRDRRRPGDSVLRARARARIPKFALAAAPARRHLPNLRQIEPPQHCMEVAFAPGDPLSHPSACSSRRTYHFVVSGRLDDVVAALPVVDRAVSATTGCRITTFDRLPSGLKQFDKGAHSKTPGGHSSRPIR